VDDKKVLIIVLMTPWHWACWGKQFFSTNTSYVFFVFQLMLRMRKQLEKLVRTWIFQHCLCFK